MPKGHLTALTAVLVALGALTSAAPATAGSGLVVGAVADNVRTSTLVDAEAKVEMIRLAGFRAIRITSYWRPGLSAPDPDELSTIQAVATAASMNGVRLFVTVMTPDSSTTPLTDEARAQFASYTAAIVHEAPWIHDLIVGNEPNLNRFWWPQFNLDGSDAAAPAYLALLAETYDAVKAVNPGASVYGGAISPRGNDKPGGIRPTHSPTVFIRDLGVAYRASGRDRPVMDALSIHVYEEHSSVPPTFAHPNITSIGIADYDKLVALLGQAFDGTAQPGSTLPILYGEFGVEAQIPPDKASLYSGTELPVTQPVSEPTQAAYYSQALALAFCQPNVMGLLIFQAQDQPELKNWQSGVFYTDGTPKSSMPLVRAALDRATGGSIAHCPGLQLPVHASYLRFGTRSAARKGIFGATFSCDLDCLYQVRVVKLPLGVTKMVRRGRAVVGQLIDIEFRPHHLGPGTYRYTLRLVHPVNPAPPTLRDGRPFNLP